MKNTYDILVAPIISEKSMDGTSNKRYTFEVKRDATKPEIAAAVAEAFGVKVAAVNTSIVKGKPKRHGYSNGYTSEWKKAVVTLTADSKTIEFFEGMN